MAEAAQPLAELVRYMDERLGIEGIRDWKNALNGLQVSNSGEVRRIAAAVDASQATIRAAIERGCDLLVVHHGLFWGGNLPVTGSRYRRLKMLLEADVAVYGAHLPLDVHPELGNNAILTRELGLEPSGTFAPHEGRDVGVTAECDLPRDELLDRLRQALNGEVRIVAGGPAMVRRVGILTGSGGSVVDVAAAAGVDTLITGEGAHHSYIDAMEAGINLVFGGHYATEVFGVRALAADVAGRFGLSWHFIDSPTGM